MGFFRQLEDDVKELGRDVEDETKALGRKIDDEILQPIGDTVEALVDNPRALAGLALAIAFPGAGSALGAQLGLFGTVGQVVGQTILNTVINGGDVKQAVISAALPVAGAEVTGQVSKLLTAADISGTLNTVISNAVTQGATAAALNQDIEKAILGSLIQSAPAIIDQYVPEFKNFPRAAREAAVAATADLIVTGGDNLGKIATAGVASGLTDYALKNIDGYENLRPAQRDIVRSRISNVLQGKDLSAELLNGAMSWGLESVQNYNRQENAARKLYKAQTNRELPESFLAEYSGDIDNLVAEVDNLVVSDSEKTQLAKELFGSDIGLGFLANAPREFTEDQFRNWLDATYAATQNAASGNEYTQDQLDGLTSFAMGAPEYLGTVTQMLDDLKANLSPQELGALSEKFGGYTNLLDALPWYDPSRTVEVATQYLAELSPEVEIPGMKELEDILAGAGSGTQYAGAGSGTATDAGGGGGPDTSWAVTAADERIVGMRTRDDGSKAVTIERINPNNPSETLTYEAVRDPETGEVYYEWGGIEFDEDGNPTLGGSSVSASKPSWTWGLPEGVGSPEVDEPDVPPDFNFGDLDLFEPPQEPTIDDLIKELTPTEPEPTPVEPTPSEPLPETTVDDLIKDLTPVEPAPVEPTPSEPPPETAPVEPTPVEQTPTEPVQPAPEQPTPIEPTPTDPEQTPAEPTPEAPTEPTPVEPEQPVGPTPVEPTTPPTDQAPPTAGITPGEVKQIVDDALAANPNLTADDVRAIVGDAVATIPNLTADQVRQIVGSELANLPVGATPGDIQTAVTDVEASISETRKILEDAIKAAQDIGLQGDAALQAGIDSAAAEIGITRETLLGQIGKTEENLRGEFATGISTLEAQTKAQYDALTAEQKALADSLAAQGATLADAIEAAKTEATGQIGALSEDMQAKYDALTAAQKAEADARVAQGQGLQDAITGVAGQVTGLEGQLTAQGKDFADQLVRQGMDYNTALQTAIDAQSALFGTQIGDVQSQIAAAEAARQADVQAQLAREQAAEQARAAQAAQAAKVAKEAQRQAAIRAGLGQGQQQLQQIAKQVPQAFQQAQTTTTPIYGEMGPYLDLGSPLDFDFFKPSPEKQAATKQQQPTKIATGGYIDDLLAGDMTVDDLLNLLR